MFSLISRHRQDSIFIKNNFIANILLLVGLILLLVFLGLKFDMTMTPIMGDDASFVLQALSIANDCDLKYEEQDGIYWKNLNWTEHPGGLMFQKYSEGYAFAKPYGYSLFLAPFIKLFSINGFAIGNVLLLGLTILFIYTALRSFYGKPESLLLTIAFTFFSYVYIYVFYVRPNLFVAMLSSIFVLFFVKLSIRSNKLYLAGLALVSALLISEKIVFLVVILPMFVLLFYRLKRLRMIVGFCIIFLVGLILFSLPYLHYSDYKAWNPYSGNRFISPASNPFTFDSKRPESTYKQQAMGRFFKGSYIIKNTFDTSQLKEKAASLGYYFFGAYTGILVFIPFAFIIILYSIFRILKKPDVYLILSLFSIFSYILFYILLFHTHYYGGGAGSSLGSRYFLQISPFIIPLVLALKLKRENVIAVCASSFILSIIFLYHHHLNPWNTYSQSMKSGYLQAMMPFEKNQEYLLEKIPLSKRVNINLYPWPPRWMMGHYTIEVNNTAMVVLITKKRIGRTFFKVDKGSDAFAEVRVNEKILWVNNGFHGSEKNQIWSKTESTLMIKNTHAIEHFSVHRSFMPGTTIKAAAGGKKIIAHAPFQFSIDTREFKDNWICVRFQSDKSGIPIIIGKGKDYRELSFLLSYTAKPEYPEIDFQ